MREDKAKREKRLNMIGAGCGLFLALLLVINVSSGVIARAASANAQTLTASAPGKVGDVTVQVVADVKGSENSSKWPTFFGCSEDWSNIYFSDKGKGIIHFKADAVTGLTSSNGSRANVTCGANVKYLNAALESSNYKQIITTADSFPTADWRTGNGGTQSAPGSLNWFFGGCGTTQSYLDDRYLVGTIKAIRVYNKVLSDAELAANREIDEVRFFAGIPVTNVVVATAVAGLEGNEGSGVYAYDEDGYTFSAPQKASLDGTVYVCAGYTLETWNGSAWSTPVSHASCSYTATDTTAKVRLTWQWQRAHADVPVALDPLFDDYVTEGLVLHLDGIRNAGADKPHDWSSSQWIDLVNGNVASIQHDEDDPLKCDCVIVVGHVCFLGDFGIAETVFMNCAIRANAIAEALCEKLLGLNVDELVFKRGRTCVDYENVHVDLLLAAFTVAYILARCAFRKMRVNHHSANGKLVPANLQL